MSCRLAVALLGCLVLGLAGCSTLTITPSGSTRETPAVADAIAPPALSKGMTAAEVRAVLGEPDDIKPFKSPDVGVYVWTYHHLVRGPERQVITSTHDVPAVNPLTGQMMTQQEPVYSQEITFFHETIELLMQGDTLLEWKRKVFAERRTI